MAVYSYQLILPTDSIIIDTAFTAAMGASFGAQVDDDAYARMDSAMSSATLIAITHEHSDHIGGIIAHSEPAEIQKALRRQAEQLGEPAALRASPGRPRSRDYVAIDYADMLAIWRRASYSIRAPGHTPGSQTGLCEARGWTRAAVRGRYRVEHAEYRNRQGAPKAACRICCCTRIVTLSS